MGEILPFTHFMGWSDQAHDRCATIMAHEIVHLHSEDFAKKWEEGEQRISVMTQEERGYHQLLFRLYVESVGVHPSDRERLKELMYAEIKSKCKRDLLAIIEEVNDQTHHHVDPDVVWQNPYVSQF